jgi:hypothetical protein
MAKYRKKPVVIEATQWFKNGDHPEDSCTMIDVPVLGSDNGYEQQLTEGKVVRRFRNPNIDGDSVCKKCDFIMHWHGWVDTLEGGHIVCPGDWIITGIKGEYYPCKPDIFQSTYGKVK